MPRGNLELDIYDSNCRMGIFCTMPSQFDVAVFCAARLDDSPGLPAGVSPPTRRLRPNMSPVGGCAPSEYESSWVFSLEWVVASMCAALHIYIHTCVYVDFFVACLADSVAVSAAPLAPSPTPFGSARLA